MKGKVIKITAAFALLAAFAGALTACGGVELSLSFYVDGERYAVVSTHGGEAVSMPADPKKDGYTFEGWFWDEGEWSLPLTTMSLMNAPLSSDMRVYAKWSPNSNEEKDGEQNDMQNADNGGLTDIEAEELTSAELFGIVPDEHYSAKYMGGTLYHWIWNGADVTAAVIDGLSSKGAVATGKWTSSIAMKWCGTRVEMNTVDMGAYHVEYFDGKGNVTVYYMNIEISDAPDASEDGGESEDIGLTHEQMIAVLDEAVARGNVVATGRRGDYVVEVPSTDELIAISGLKKSALFLSVAPFDYIRDGYVYINVVDEYGGEYRILEYGINEYDGGWYAVRIRR